MSDCIISDCYKPMQARNRCQAHYVRYKKTGFTYDPPEPVGRYVSQGTFCSKCNKDVHARGLCKSHYMMHMRKEYPDYTEYRRKIVRFRQYGITREDFILMLDSQDYRCAVCSTAIDEPTARIDHDHRCCSSRRSCGKCLRKLLCGSCNKGLGMLQDSPDILEAAAQYVRAYL